MKVMKELLKILKWSNIQEKNRKRKARKKDKIVDNNIKND
jgi:hypothetical protein